MGKQASGFVFTLALGAIVGRWVAVDWVTVALIVVAVASGLWWASYLDTVNLWWRRLRHRPRPVPLNTLDAKVKRAALSEEAHTLQFETRLRMGEVFELGYRPSALVFVRPYKRRVTVLDLPQKRVPCGRGWFQVERFTDTGFIASEIDTAGDEVTIRVWP